MDALIREQRWDDAQRALDEANALVQRYDERLYYPELLLQQATVAAARGDRTRARHCRETAVHEARASAALYAEIKAHIALVEGDASTPADVDALRDAYARLTESFDTPVTRRARALLDARA